MLHEAVRSLLEIGACIGAGAAFRVFGLFDGADAQVLSCDAAQVPDCKRRQIATPSLMAALW